MRQWTDTLTDEFDWADWPLGRYSFSEAFLSGLERQAELEMVAWVCAIVACGLADEFARLNLQRRTHRSSGAELVRHDAAHGYRCSVLSGRGAGSHLDFWRVPSGAVEFDRLMALRLVDSADAEAADYMGGRREIGAGEAGSRRFARSDPQKGAP